jgi:hypothetical protein
VIGRLRRLAPTLAAAAALLALLPGSSPAGTRETPQVSSPFTSELPGGVLRDAVLDGLSRRAARAIAADARSRYPVHDGAGRSVEIRVSSLCQLLCPGLDPQGVADFLGGLPHRGEIGALIVDLVTGNEIATRCGPGTLACYYPAQNLIVARGDDATVGGVSRDFVLAHEYGHHLANNRSNPPWPSIDWGPKRWSTYERICQGVSSGRYYPGDEGARYYQNPGEAFAEAFAFNRFPNETTWEWDPSLRPDANAFKAIRRDALNPWTGRTRVRWRGRLPAGGQVVRRFPTPLDGRLSVRVHALQGGGALGFAVSSGNGEHSFGAGSADAQSVNGTLCGLAAVRVAVVGPVRSNQRFQLTLLRP